MHFSRGYSQSRDQNCVSHIPGTFFTIQATRAFLVLDGITIGENNIIFKSNKKHLVTG